MKNILFAVLILIGLTVLVLQSPSATAETSTTYITAELSGTGSTSATVKAKDETTGQIYTLSQIPATPNRYTTSGVATNHYTITACASSSNGSVSGVNFNTVGYITMASGQCGLTGD
jgi:hypothetical protein